MRKGLLLTILLSSILLLGSTASPTVRASPDAPLSVYQNEYINATVEVDGQDFRCGSWNVTGFIIVKDASSEPVYDLWLPIKPEGRVSLSSSPAYATVTKEDPPSWVSGTHPSAYGSASDYEWWHITELHPGDSVVFDYRITSLTGCPPLTINETYSPQKIVDGQSSTVSVSLTITNGFTTANGYAYDADVQIKVRKILPADNTAGDGWKDQTGNPAFSNAGTPDTGYGSSSLSTDNKELYWTGDGNWPGTYITLTAGSSMTLENFQVTGTPNLGEVGGTTQKVEMGRVYVYFKTDKPVTDTRVGYVYAMGKASLEVKKEQDTANPTTWHETLVVYDTSGVFDYEVVNTTVWATQGNTPDSALIDTPVNSRHTDQQGDPPLSTIGPGEGSTSYTYGPFDFTYNLVPKIWALFKARIQRDETHGWMNYTNTTVFEQGGLTNYTVVEKIWVVKGYLVKARKEVRPGTTSGEFCIGITLENLGEWMTPYVEFYDLVPTNFVPNPVSKEGNMKFYPLSMLAQDADPDSPPDYSLKTAPTGYSGGYVWKSYPLPEQRGFVEWFPDTSTVKTVTVKTGNGDRTWTVQVVDSDTIKVNGTAEYDEGDEFSAGSTTFLVVLVQDTVGSGGGYVVVSAKGHYDNLDMDVYNPVFVHYCVSGSGDYNLTDIFVVGVDPRNTLDVNSVLMPFAAMSMGATSFEIWFVIAAVAAIAAGVYAEIRGRRRGPETSPLARP